MASAISVGSVGQQRDRLARALLQLVHARGDLGGKDLGLADLVDAGDQERIARQEFEHAEAPRAARDQMMVAVRRGHVAQDFGDGADAMEMLGPGRVDRGVALQQHADRLVGLRGRLGAGDRLRAAERERHHDAGEQHGIAGRQDDQRAVGKLGVRGGPLAGRDEAAACSLRAGCGASADCGVTCSVSFMSSAPDSRLTAWQR